MPWEEVAAHVLWDLFHQGHCNPLVSLLALWCGQVGVEISSHQQRGPTSPLADGRDDILYGQVIVWGQESPHDITLSVSRLQLES